MKDDAILFDSPEAARPATVSGWISASGRFFTDERMARFDGCTHIRCQHCDAPTPKGYLFCNACREERDRAAYAAMEARDWDGEQMIYCEDREEYFSDPDEAMDQWEGEGLPRLVLCEPTFARAIDSGIWEDDLPGEEHDVPYWLAELIGEFNAKLKGTPVLSWGMNDIPFTTSGRGQGTKYIKKATSSTASKGKK